MHIRVVGTIRNGLVPCSESAVLVKSYDHEFSIAATFLCFFPFSFLFVGFHDVDMLGCTFCFFKIYKSNYTKCFWLSLHHLLALCGGYLYFGPFYSTF